MATDVEMLIPIASHLATNQAFEVIYSQILDNNDLLDINCYSIVFCYPSDACELTLDPSTAHRKLKFSDNNTKVGTAFWKQPYSDHPERFYDCYQVLCTN